MRIHFLGTGAADWDWKNWPEGTRGSTMTLLNGNLLVDAGTSALRNLNQAGIPYESIRSIVITHSHADHFYPKAIETIAAGHPVDVYASPQALERLSGETIVKHPLTMGQTHSICGMQVTVLPANHTVGNPLEETFHFLFEGNGKILLYQLDGAWFGSREVALIGGRRIDAIIWDATVGSSYDWRFSDHNDLGMIDYMRESMKKTALLNPGAIHIFNHIARTLWPAEPEARAELAKQHNGILAEDNTILEL